MSQEEFKAQFLQALVEDEAFADQVLSAVSHRVKLDYNLSSGWRNRHEPRIVLQLGSETIYAPPLEQGEVPASKPDRAAFRKTLARLWEVFGDNTEEGFVNKQDAPPPLADIHAQLAVAPLDEMRRLFSSLQDSFGWALAHTPETGPFSPENPYANEEPMLYRDHRGGLAESLATQREIASTADLLAHLNTTYAPFGGTVAEVKSKYVGFDARTSWHTHHVLCRLEGETDFTVAGMSDAPLPA